ncbi:MAG: hypothetical protein IT342_21575 [Candidatus Melainabacteria bacterium]|nr:hypothetical protein [Candidatus Melainabacteria bacterium]
MNPTTINTKEHVAESKSQSERNLRQSQSAASGKASQNATPVCKNGVCMVTWKPTKPQAA